jgi:ABC-type antimicrobial peptide transport system permease subunit
MKDCLIILNSFIILIALAFITILNPAIWTVIIIIALSLMFYFIKSISIDLKKLGNIKIVIHLPSNKKDEEDDYDW